MAQTPRYGLPFLLAGQAQKEITHNDALARVDTLIHLAVESRHNDGTTAATGTSWIVPANATGMWTGRDKAIAIIDESGWSFVPPLDGCIAFVRDESVFIHYNGGDWRDAWPVPALTAGGTSVPGGPPAIVADPTGGTVVDAEARVSVGQLLAVLRTMGFIAVA